MKYMLMLRSDEAAWNALSKDAQDRIMQRHDELIRELTAKKQFVATNRLRPSAETKTLRRDGEGGVVTDGPFMETKEAIGGYYIVDVDSMDDALAIARRIPAQCSAAIEVRQFRQEA